MFTINHWAKDIENKVDSRNHIGLDGLKRGINPKTGKEYSTSELAEILYRSDFITERAKMSSTIFLKGYAALALVTTNGKKTIRMYDVMSYKKILREIIDITIQTINDNGNQEQPILTRFYKEDGKIFTTGVQIKDDKYINIGKAELLEGWTQVPVGLIRNNSKAESGIDHLVGMLSQLTFFGKELKSEWENIKAKWRENIYATSGNTQNNGRTEEMFNPNLMYGNAKELVIAGALSFNQLMAAIVLLEDRIAKYAFQARDTMSTGANKHNSEIGMFSQLYSEQIQTMIEQRERDLNYFFSEIINKQGKIPISNKTIKIEYSDFEKGKREGFRLMSAQTEYYNKQGLYNNSLSQKTKEETKNLSQNSYKNCWK